MEEYYDKIISLGSDCSVAGSLRKLEYKNCTLNFDWCHTSFSIIFNSISTKFKNFDNITFSVSDVNNIIKTIDSDMYFVHDYKYNELLDDENKLNLLYNKLKVRSLRFDEILSSDDKILFVRKSELDTVADMYKLKIEFRKNYPNLKFKILIINNIKENSDDEDIIHIYKEQDIFISRIERCKTDYIYPRDIKKGYRELYDIFKNIKTKSYPQPNNRDSEIIITENKINKINKDIDSNLFNILPNKIILTLNKNYKNNYCITNNSNLEVNEISKDEFKLTFISNNINDSAGLYFIIPHPHELLPKKIYKYCFNARLNKLDVDFRLKIYTGIKWIIIDEKINEENKQIIVEEEFDFNSPSTYRIGFANPKQDLELYISNPVLLTKY